MTFEEKFRYIRSQVDQKDAVPGLSDTLPPVPAIKRTSSLLVTRFPKSRIEHDLHHPKLFGFLAPINQPYEPYGLPKGDFDVLDWLSRSFRVKPPRHSHHQRRSIYEREKWRQLSAESTEPLNTIHVPMLPTYNKEKIVIDSSVNDNGSSVIAQYLKKIKSHQKKIMCGSSYMEAQSEAHQKPVVTTTNKLYCSVIQPSNNEGAQQDIYSSNTSFEIVRPLFDANEYLVKLKSIYSILCFLSNVKSKELKSKTPLSLSILNSLSEKPCINLLKLQEQYKPSSNDTKKMPELYGMSKTSDPHQRCPPWQFHIVFVNITNKEKEEDLNKRMNSCYEEFQQLKKDLGSKLKHQLRIRYKNTPQQLLNKIQELQYGPSPIKQLQQMRDRSCMHSVMNKLKKKIKPQWYTLLELELKNNVNEESLLSNGKKLLEKIQQFIFFDANSITLVLEKLCLYLMSLPAYELCTRPVIDAIMFVLEYILQTSPKLCTEWLRLRRLPWQQ